MDEDLCQYAQFIATGNVLIPLCTNEAEVDMDVNGDGKLIKTWSLCYKHALDITHKILDGQQIPKEKNTRAWDDTTEKYQFSPVELTGDEVDLLHCLVAKWNTPEAIAETFKQTAGFSKPENWIKLLLKLGLPI